MKRILSLLVFVLALQTVLAQKVSVLGDSYSTFKGYVTPDTNALWYPFDPARNNVQKLEQSWVYKFVNENGFTLEKNNSFSGSTISNTGYNKEDYTSRSFTTRMSNLGNPDIIIIFGATNDSWAGSPIGEYKYKKINKQDLYSFRPAMAYMCKYMKSHYKKSKIYFVLNSELKEEINESAKTILKRYGIPCIELHDIEKQDGHPSIKGMQSIVDQLNEYILPEIKK